MAHLQAMAKAGVYAVRQGPVLWDNIQRLIEFRPLRPYTLLRVPTNSSDP